MIKKALSCCGVAAFLTCAIAHAELPLPDAQPHDFYLAVFRTRTARDGFLEEDSEIWSRDGRLVAQSRQLGLLLAQPS